MIITDNANVKITYHASLNGFIRDIESPGRPESGVGSSSTRNGTDFTGGLTYEQAIHNAKYGDASSAKRLRQAQTSAKINEYVERMRNETVADVWGYTPHVPNYLAGNPLTMMRTVKNVPSAKIVNVAINFAVSGRQDAEDVTRVASLYAGAIENIEAQGYRCNVFAVMATKPSRDSDARRRTLVIKIKSDDEPMNLATMAFPLSHVAMFRRLGFRWIEYLDIDLGSGYGKPFTNKAEIKRQVERATGLSNVLVFSVQDEHVKLTDAIEQMKGI